MAFIIKPLVTEKMTKITDKSSESKKLKAANEKAAKVKNAVEEKVSYVVKKKGKADVMKEKTVYKLEIKAEIESLYNVTVLDVNTMRYAGKRSSRYTKAGLVKGQKSAFKKAIVTLKAGDQIDFYSNI